MLDYTTNWVATGAGYDNTIGAMWVNPAAVGINSQAIYPYYTLSHEMFHAISLPVRCRQTKFRLSVMQRCQQWPVLGTLGQPCGCRYVLGNIWKYNKSEHVLNTACRLFFNDDMAKMNDFVAQTAMKNITFDYAEGSTGYYYKSAVADANNNTDGTYINAYDIIMKKHRTIPFAVNYDKRHFAIRDCQAPQDFGYNAIQVSPKTWCR